MPIYTGTAGADTLVGSPDADIINGLGGSDTLQGLGGDDILNGDSGNDTVEGGDGNDRLYGGDNSDNLYGGAGDDYLDSGPSGAIAGISNPVENLYGGEGNDILTGQGGQSMYGGVGNDTFYVDAQDGYVGDFNYRIPGDRVFEREGEGTDTIRTTVSWTISDTQHVEVMILEATAPSYYNSLTGNNHANLLIGNQHANVLAGGGGDDVLDGRGGADPMSGGSGSDTFYVDNPDDLVIDAVGIGVDRVAASVSYSLPADADIEILEAVNLASAAALDLGGNQFGQTIIGNAGANIINGGGGDDELIGLGGNDVLIGSPGNDRMHGGTGDDTYYVDAAGDFVWEAAGEGYDRIAATGSFVLAAGSSIEVIEAGTLVSTYALDLTGNNFAQRITGNNGANRLNGGGGSDVLNGLGGDDILIGGEGADSMMGGAGNDTYYVDHSADLVWEWGSEGTDRIATSVSLELTGGSEVELLEAVNLNSTQVLDLTGSDYANKIIGNAGNNVINGRGGNDVLIGGGGADQFQFTTALGGANVDRIEDFQVGIDTMALDDAIFPSFNPGSLDPAYFRSGAEAQDSDDRIIYNPQTGALMYDPDGAGGQAAVQFATLQANLGLSSTDFIII